MQEMGKSRKKQAVGRQNYARKDPEYAVGQRVQRGEAFGTITDVNFNLDAKASGCYRSLRPWRPNSLLLPI